MISSRIRKTAFLSISMMGLHVGICNASEISTNAALMQAMDKVTGRVNKITIPVNSKLSFGDFSLVLRSCKKRSAEETPENFAFVDVADKSFGEEEYNIFRGWLVSSTPGINAIEHPIYDVWLLECIDTDIDSSKLLTEEELNNRENLPIKDLIKEVADTPKEEEINTSSKVIHIKEFIQQDRDIEKDIKEAPTYIKETSEGYVSDIDEGNEPENLLQFTKMVEEVADKKLDTSLEHNEHDDISDALEAEINKLKESSNN